MVGQADFSVRRGEATLIFRGEIFQLLPRPCLLPEACHARLTSVTQDIAGGIEAQGDPLFIRMEGLIAQG